MPPPIPRSIVIPAHDEESVISRLLAALFENAQPGELDVVVVANGCTDRTAAVAAEFADVRVIETLIPSKAKALRLGDEAAHGFPRLYVDADVVLRTADVRALCDALDTPGILAAAPRRDLPMDGVAALVRWYYDVWARLPGVRDGLFGRGVIATSEAGHARLGNLPEVMSDDLAIAMAYEADEQIIVPAARSVIRPPRTYGDLLRRRVRAMTGNRQYSAKAEQAPTEAGVPGSAGGGGTSGNGRPVPRTSLADLRMLALREPHLTPKIAFFAMTAVIARARARRAARRDDHTWLRDSSSRTS